MSEIDEIRELKKILRKAIGLFRSRKHLIRACFKRVGYV